jgi:vacuolar-type H+-ATPase subunit H
MVESLMQKAKLDGNGSLEGAEEHVEAAATEMHEEGTSGRSEIIATAATVAVVGVGALAFEAALIPGLVLGVAAMWVPQYFPKLGETLNPLFRSTVRSVYKIGRKSREMMAEAHEQVHDIVAEVHAEGDADLATVKSAASNARN